MTGGVCPGGWVSAWGLGVCLGGVSAQGVCVCPGVFVCPEVCVCPVGWLPATPPPRGQNNMCKKHYLAATTLQTVKIGSDDPLSLWFWQSSNSVLDFWWLLQIVFMIIDDPICRHHLSIDHYVLKLSPRNERFPIRGWREYWMFAFTAPVWAMLTARDIHMFD